MLPCCLTVHELRTPCTSPNAINDINSAYFWQRPSSCTLRLKISTSVDHWKSTQKESTPDLIMKWKPTVPLHANTRQLFLLCGNRTSGALLGQTSNWCGDYVQKQVPACLAYLFRNNIPSDANQLTAQIVPLNSISMHRYEPQVWLQSCLNEHTYTARSSINNDAQDTVVNRNNKKRNARITDCGRCAEMRKETVAMGFGE